MNIENTNGHRTVVLMLLYQFPTKWLRPAPAGRMGRLTMPLVLFGIAVWLVLMFVIYRRYAKTSR